MANNLINILFSAFIIIIIGLFLGYTILQTPWILFTVAKTITTFLFGNRKKYTVNVESVENSKSEVLNIESFKALEKEVQRMKRKQCCILKTLESKI